MKLVVVMHACHPSSEEARQEDLKLKGSVGDIARPRVKKKKCFSNLAYAGTEGNYFQKKFTKKKNNFNDSNIIQ